MCQRKGNGNITELFKIFIYVAYIKSNQYVKELLLISGSFYDLRLLKLI